MNFKSILIVGLSMATLVQALPAHAGYGSIYYYEGLKVVDLFTDHPGYRTSTNTSPTNVQNAEANKNSNATDESLETKMKNAERLREYGDATRDIIRNMYP
jgi:hypothetical protein